MRRAIARQFPRGRCSKCRRMKRRVQRCRVCRCRFCAFCVFGHRMIGCSGK